MRAAARFDLVGRCGADVHRFAHVGRFESFSEVEWTETPRYKLVHVKQFQRFGTTDHGPAFERRVDEVDALIRVRRFASAKFRLSCVDCGAVVARRYRDCKLVRRHGEYVSSCCSASLSLEARE